MPSHARNVSPVGTSRFEQPFKPVSPTSLASGFSRYEHAKKPSLSRWSLTDSHDYSTGASSVEQLQEDPDKTPVKSGARRRYSDGAALDDDDDETNEEAPQYAHPRGTVVINYSKPRLQPYPEITPFDGKPGDDEETTPSPVDYEEWYAQMDENWTEDSRYGDECPDGATLAATYNIPLYSADGAMVPFGTLHDPKTAINQRQMIIFIRHFYCGACQAFVKSLSAGISMQEYLSIPIPTSIVIIGCGNPALIPFYREITGTTFPIFAEPSRRLYKKFGMVLTASFGKDRPEYMHNQSVPSMLAGMAQTIRHGLQARKEAEHIHRLTKGLERRNSSSREKTDYDENIRELRRRRHLDILKKHEAQARAKALRKRDVVKGGNMFQVGGEMLFEDGEVVWSHTMRHFRDHTEISSIRRLLELDE